MQRSLETIQAYKLDDSVTLTEHPWLQYIVSAEERMVNLERVQSLHDLERANPVLDYVEKSLEALNRLHISFWIQEIVEEVLIWSEVAKGGTLRQRMQWQKQGVHLMAHNIGSSEIYQWHSNPKQSEARRHVTCTLIQTHGLIGQYLRGEVPFAVHRPLIELVQNRLLAANELRDILLALNQCILEAVSMELWTEIAQQVTEVIELIIHQVEDNGFSLKNRLKRLRASSISRGENFDQEFDQLSSQPTVIEAFQAIDSKTLWFVEAALHEFSFEEFAKLFLIILSSDSSQQADHISFERMMNDMYYDYRGQKKINVYKKRIIEKYLRECTFEDIASARFPARGHLFPQLKQAGPHQDTVYFHMEFSAAADKLIQFCVEAEKSPLYEKAVLMLFDLFELRRDAYDRFHNEEEYLTMMNQTADYKKIILDYIVGKRVVDIGPGGGVMLDLIEDTLPDKQAIGIDISQNVIEALERKRQLENRKWMVMKGDALNLKEYVEPGSIDTVIFSSILHELFSYLEYEGKSYNHATVAAALRSAFDVIPSGGRIIIRDGIMSEPTEQQRIITFLDVDGMQWLERYAKDFTGRTIQFERLGDNEVLMPINDAMEFLYTYTWGEEAYVHEVQEQFGYLTPSGYESFIHSVLGPQAHIVVSRYLLQEGYTEALSPKIQICNEQREPVSLPDSTCLIVIQKQLD
ncbi:Methyltransferase domain-containing protein [Paenibacillus sp. 1_12]|uniref:class I SAM-dependent methyltransferase n=1 Tax=Paenibacillus sp. 1_12 TaxID=1566278 RepID=UPI0008E3AA3A|nr:class I SAM-dependent methyltransferase [Paenibacillus sp. 1_12]SFL53061.1 Methyltransferase domain-containing protein [Paenibacillus sp. 1_12]